MAPHRVETAVVMGPLAEMREGLRAAGVEVDGPSRQVDLVVGEVRDAREVLAVTARSHVVLGPAVGQAVRRRSGPWHPLLLRGATQRPTAVVPLWRREPLQQYVRTTAVRPGRRGELRNQAARASLMWGPLAGAVLPRIASCAVRFPEPGRPVAPRFLEQARDLGLPGDPGWVLTLGDGDDLQRAVFHVLHGGTPRWVVKLSRVPAATSAFDRDEAGLSVVARAGGVVAQHAPRLLGRYDVDGLPASVETAGPGPQLVHQVPGARSGVVESVARWVVQVAEQTARDAAALDDELDRLEREVLPHWRAAGAPDDLVARLRAPGCGPPAVLAHQDLGTWNVVAAGGDFMAVDWESATADGMPLWDLVYFLGDALVRAEGVAGPAVLLERCLELFRGRAPGSPVLFRWVREMVAALGVAPDQVGALVTLCWLHHGLSAERRERALAGASAAPVGHLAQMAGPWLADPELGPGWSTWRTS
ncbi:hypothetical protein [Nocardioides aurantiacus]|uniref:hypothetical protein n=1 Tax=Nocardioides aurantiacus TaxID=86796 RepID=UPI0011CE1A41|nr:hypothetical protein [Nocardioides aurantiacus]